MRSEIVEDPLHLLAASTAASVGNEFLTALVKALSHLLPVNLCFIAVGIGDPPHRARALFAWKDGETGVPLEYELEGSPCWLVYQGQEILIPSQLAERFPRETGVGESYYGLPMRNHKGQVIGHFAVLSRESMRLQDKIRDIVRIFGLRAQAELQRIAFEREREELIERLRLQRQEALQSSKLMSSALGMVAHDIRNPLGVVTSRAEFIKSLHEIATNPKGTLDRAAYDERLLHSLKVIISAADRMNKMISELLEAARTEATQINLRRAKLELSEVVRSAISLHADTIVAKYIVIDEQLEGDLLVCADEDKLIHAIGNLISNSIKYSPPSSRITVSTGRRMTEKVAYITVADEGAGMTAEDIAEAFTPFRTLSAKPTSGETSTGLGLTIVKTIAEAHGGAVRIHSDGKEKGTAITISLPLFEPASAVEVSA